MPLAAKTMHAASFLLMLLAIGPPASNGQALDSQVNFAVAVEGQVDSSMAVSAVASPAVSIQLDMPSRLMWEEYDGYCGETSLQMSALYFGAYLSQRALRAAGGGPQNGGQLLLVCLIGIGSWRANRLSDIGPGLCMGGATPFIKNKKKYPGCDFWLKASASTLVLNFYYLRLPWMIFVVVYDRIILICTPPRSHSCTNNNRG